MRLHALTATAFGPFADTVQVDFDALSGAGLFLLSGPTGAGKSSILDAVCFGLYGDVPGDRSAAKRLRCDTAPDHVPPRVTLEVTLSGRRFRIERSPAWVRPKRRGTGTTLEHARVVMLEWRGQEWLPVSSRLDETGHLVTELMGMNLPQFCQVALLPQGRFQAFLRARSEERHALLQRVFRTGRFDQVERWLRERRTELRRCSAEHQAVVADLVSRTSEIADVDAASDWQSGDAAGADTALRAWVSDALTTAVASERQANEIQELATSAVARAEGVHAEVLAALALFERAVRAEAGLKALEDARPRVEEARDRILQGRRAETVAPVLGLLDEAAASLEATKAEARQARKATTDLLGDSFGALSPTEAHSLAVRARADLTGALPLVGEVARLEREIFEFEELVVERQQRLASVQIQLGAMPDAIASARLTRERALVAEETASRLAALVDTCQQQQAAHERAVRIAAEHHDAAGAAEDAMAALNSAKERWLDLRERRLEGMASEIAAALVVGDSCPVCGSCDHPAPAVDHSDTPDAQAERAARALVDDHEIQLEAFRQRVRELATQHAIATSAAGPDPEALAGRLACLEAEHAEASTRSQGLSHAQAQLEQLEKASQDLEVEREAVASGVQAAATTLADLHDALSSARGAVADVIEFWSVATIAEIHDRLTEAATLLEAQSASANRERLRREAEAAARHAAARATAEAGFTDVDEARSVLLAPDLLARLEQEVEEHGRQLQRWHDELDSHGVREALKRGRPEVEAAARSLAAARQDLLAATAHQARRQRTTQRLTEMVAALDTALDDWAPVREELDLTADLTAFVEGKSPDNRLQMRLSAYVLAHRLGQVVDAANERLWSMSSQRYALVHTGRRGAGETRGGLSLVVQDAWSGEERDPATLSGGESFVVSLALALGLADVISHEAGGAEVHTLFVDEGFGALDSETLDDVMDTLDELRDGGRVVGVVSHVAEMQARIPTQLEVRKSPTGSTVELSLG